MALALVVFAPIGALASGGWMIVASPDAVGVPNSDLGGVACSSPTACWTVGASNTNRGSDDQTLIEKWDGTSWSIVTSQNATTNDDLADVTCTSAASCWAVGYANNGTNYLTMIEFWNGTSWSIVSSQNVSSTDNFLGAVSCVSASDCWTVGQSGTSLYQTLAEHWDGLSWTIASTLNPVTSQDNVFQDVTCSASNDCWGVGYSAPHGSNNAQTLTEHWDGSSWSAVAAPDPSTLDDLLASVTCTSTSDCWAAGSQKESSTSYQTLTERWNGTSWAVVTSQDTSGTQDNFLYDVSCLSAMECWSVGTAASQTFTQHWDGISWTIAPSPDTSTSEPNYLFGLTCVPGSECWATGNSTNSGGNDHTLTEELISGPSPQVPDAPWAALIPLAGGAAVAVRRLVKRGFAIAG